MALAAARRASKISILQDAPDHSGTKL
jgi:hypothetical protein